MKKILFLFTFLFILFVSMSFVSAADNNTNDINVTVSHGKVEQGKDITFVITAKDSNGNPVVGKNFGISFRGRSDKSNNPAGRHTNSDPTDNNGVVKLYVEGSVTKGWFDYFDFTVSDGFDENKYPTGKVYYKSTFDFTIKSGTTSITFDKPNYTAYEGQYTKVTAYVKSNGVPVSTGYLVWSYANGKAATTTVANGISIFNYNSYVLGNNLINVKYIGFGSSVIPGLVISGTNAYKSFNINIKGASDLVISKVVRSGNKYKVTVRNAGNGASTTSKLKLWYSSKKYKIVTVAALGAGRSKTYTVNFFKYSSHKKYKKYAQINYNKAAYEKNYTNNKLGFKSNVAYGYCADLSITKVTRSGNNYVVTIKNNGKLAASPFKLKFWYGTKTKPKGLVPYTISKFGQFGNKLPPGVSITLTIPYYKYKTHSKYYKFVSINSDKKVPESNYANNLKKFKV